MSKLLRSTFLLTLLCAQLPAAVFADEETKPVHLTGGVRRDHASLDGTAASDSPADAKQLRTAALEKLKANNKLTAQDFRDLGIGILGYETDRKYFSREAHVTGMYRGGPAAAAGIRIGDIVIVKDADDSAVSDPTVQTFGFSCGDAGAIVDVNIKRGNDITTYHLVRMNIEDVPDDKVRQQYERLVQQTGLRDGSVILANPPKELLKDLHGY